MQVLIVEDDPALAGAIEDGLGAHGFTTAVAGGAESAWEALWGASWDAIVLDVMLPEGSEAGFDWAEAIRDADFRQPILFLTARESLPDRVRGLEVGDDYLAKPFALAELVARLRALHRRGEVRPRRVRWGEVVLTPETREVRREDELVRLTGKEYQVLELLMLAPGRIWRREEMLDRVWGAGFDPPSNLVDVYVKNLRAKLGEGIVETVRGLGYRFSGEAPR